MHGTIAFKIRKGAAGFTAAVGCAVLLGWTFGFGALKSVAVGFISMKANTAMSFILFGAALWLFPSEAEDRRSTLTSKVCSWIVLAISALVLAECVLGWNFGIDQLLFLDPLPPESLEAPGRMVPATALSFLLLASGLLLSHGGRDKSLAAGQALAAAAGLIGLLAAISYGYGERLLYGFGHWTRMALHTSLCILTSSLGVLAISPQRGLMAVITNEKMGGYLARRILPTAVLLPIALGWLFLKGVSSKFFGLAFGTAFSVCLFIGVLIGVVLWIAASLDRLDAARAEGDMRYRSILANALEGVIILDPAGRIENANEAYCRMSGYSRAELLAMTVPDLEAAESPAETAEHIGRISRAGGDFFETKHRRKNGEIFTVEVSARATGENGRAVIAFIRDVSENKKTEEELNRLKTALEQAGESIFITDLKGTIVFVNPAFESATGFSRREALGQTLRILKSGVQDAAFYRELWATITSGRTWKGRIVNKCKDGSLRTEDSTISPLRDAQGKIVSYVAVKRDATEHIRLEGELRQSQKMESVGRLAGGVAHDFNNILTAINGYTGFAMTGLAQDDPRRADLKEVLAAGERAARLTRQLLAFSRKQILSPQVLDINATVNETIAMLKRLIGEDIALKSELAPQPCLVKVDAGQMEQVFLNLAVNARDAMPKGGSLTFSTQIVAASKIFLSRHPKIPGPLVCLSIHDTGCGMSEEVKAHIFEPFFTTKEKGKGTGLGLSMVYGIVKQSGGDIEVESTPDRGTVFRIYFPQILIQTEELEKKAETDAALEGSETILLVDDEDLLRRFALRALTAHGYTVLAAASADEALAVLERHGKPVDLLVTDAVMPGQNGRELARTISARKMLHRTLYVSGYTDDAIVKHGILEPGLALLYKPFSAAELLRKTRDILDGPADQARA